jgi:hypothetical protein
MRKRTFRLVVSGLLVILFLSFAIYASAESAEELLKNPDLTDTERNAIAKAISKQATSSLPTTLKGMLEWQEMGDAFATTIKAVCQTLNVEVNAFLKSDVGKLTAAVIVYKMVGKDILRIILYTSIWLGVTFFIALSIKFLHMNKIVSKTTEEDGKITKQAVAIERIEWTDDILKNVSMIVHIIAWFIFSCIIAASII